MHFCRKCEDEGEYSEVEMKKLGEYLKAEREKKNLSIHEIGIQLKISPKILQAIEAGDSSKLPAKTFLRGFVRSYAQFLKLDVDETLRLFQEAMGSTHPELPKPGEVGAATSTGAPPEPAHDAPLRSPATNSSGPRETKRFSMVDESFSTNKVLLSLAIVALISLILFVGKVIEKYKKEQVVPETPVVQAPVPPTPEPAAEVPAEPAPVVDVPPQTTAPAPVVSKIEEKVEKPTPEKPKTKPPEKVADKPIEKTPEKATEKAPEKPIEKPVEKVVEKPAETPQNPETAPLTEVIVEATGPVSIEYDLGTGSTKTISLDKNQYHTFRSRSAISLNVSDGGLLNVFLNGKSRGVAGTKGASAQLRYPKQ